MSEIESFYILVDISSGWPWEARRPLCKFGVTKQPVSDRCKQNQTYLRGRWGVEARLSVSFVATGVITTLESDIATLTEPWSPDHLDGAREWRRCPPRQLARIAVLLSEKHLSEKPLSEEPLSEEPLSEKRPRNGRFRHAPGWNGSGKSDFGLDGDHIEGEPIEGDHIEHGSPYRVFREPLPTPGREPGSPPGPPLPLTQPVPSMEPSGRSLGEEEIPSGFGQAPRRTRCKARRLRRKARRQDASWQGSPRRESPGRESSRTSSQRSTEGGTEPPRREEHLSVQISKVRKELLEELLSHSSYKALPAYLRSVSTGWDRRGSIVAKSGILFHWARAHLGERVGREEWAELSGLLERLLGEGRARELLRVIKRHLLARGGGTIPKPYPPGRGRLNRQTLEIKQKTCEELPEKQDFRYPISLSIWGARKALIEEHVAESDFESLSAYLRSVALGWDRDPSVLAQSAVLAHWIEARLGEEIKEEEWKEELGQIMQERFGVFLFGAGLETGLEGNPVSGPPRRLDPQGALQRAEQHLLAASPEAVSEETGISVT